MLVCIAYPVRKVFSLILVAVLLIAAPAYKNETHTVKDAEHIRLKMTVLSDIHIESLNTDGTMVDGLERFNAILKDVKNADMADDATVFLGDNVMNGQHREEMLFYGMLALHGFKGSSLLVAEGNHDGGNDEEPEKYPELLEQFYDYNRYFLDRDMDTPYYSETVNGYTLIVIGSEESCCDEPVMSETQEKWFAETMKNAAKDGKPVFVFAHHPMDYYNNYDNLYEIMNRYDNVFYFYGHTHCPLMYWSFDREGKVVTVNCPKTSDVFTDEDISCIGLQLEVYDDSIVVRPRNYVAGTWNEEYEHTYTLSE